MTEWGLCHLCPEKGPRPIQFCPPCGHYFCGDCRTRYWDRGLAAVKELVRKAIISGRSPEGYCCGPEENAEQRTSGGTPS